MNFNEWTTEELLAQVRQRLPEDQLLDIKEGDNSWLIRFLLPAEGQAPKVIWADEALTSRDALFKAFQRLWAPGQHTVDGVWSNNAARPSLRAVAQKISKKYADPADLDPDVVASVYSRASDKGDK